MYETEVSKMKITYLKLCQAVSILTLSRMSVFGAAKRPLP